MTKRALFDNPVQAITVTHIMVSNLVQQLWWTMFALAHLAIALTAATLAWWHGLTPALAKSAFLDMLGSTTLAVAGAVAGISLLGVLSGYLAATRWLWQRVVVPRLTDHLLRGTVEGE